MFMKKREKVPSHEEKVKAASISYVNPITLILVH